MTHGTNHAYRDGCRCSLCTEAHRVAGELYRQRSRQGVRVHNRRIAVDNPHHPHGTISCYTNDGCGCDACKEAWRLYHADRKRRVATLGAVTVDAERVRRFVLRAQLNGHGSRAIGELAGVASSAVRNIAAGRTKTVRVRTAVRLVRACRRLAAVRSNSPMAATVRKTAFSRA